MLKRYSAHYNSGNTKMDRHQQVLIVEDDANDAFFIQRALQLSGITQLPHVCTNAPDAIRYLQGADEYADRARYPFPNLLLTDLKMPGGSGFELLEWIRDNPALRVIPTVIMSSSSMREDVKYAYCLGANAYLCKPTDSGEFKQMFTALLRFWGWCEVPELDAPSCEELERKHRKKRS